MIKPNNSPITVWHATEFVRSDLKKYTNKIWSTGNANFGTIKQTWIPTEYVAQNSRKLIKGRGPEEKKKVPHKAENNFPFDKRLKIRTGISHTLC